MKNKLQISGLIFLAIFFLAPIRHFSQTNQKWVVFEELTGTWCSYCPRGIVYGDSLMHKYDNVVFISIHTSDPMEYDEYSLASGLSSAPSANVNRKLLGTEPTTWESKRLQEMAVNPPAYISVTTTYDNLTRSLSATISANFIQALSGDYRLAAVVIEDGVTGPAPGYNQSNSYSGGSTPMGGFENLPNPVPAQMMAYDHVPRKLLGGYNGQPGSLPATITNGSQHSYAFNYTVPTGYNPDYITVAGFLIENSTGFILNSGLSTYLSGDTNAKPLFTSSPVESGFTGSPYSYSVYTHDPDNYDVTIAATQKPSWLSFQQTGQTEGILFGTPPTTGTFDVTLTVSDGILSTDQSFQIQVGSGTGQWEIVGTPGISQTNVNGLTIATGTDGTPYMASGAKGSGTNYTLTVSKFDGQSWVPVGSPSFAQYEGHMGFDLDPDNDPWIAYNSKTDNTRLQVKKSNGTSWENVGGLLSTGPARMIDLKFNNAGIPYIVYYDQSSGSFGFVKKYEGGSWIDVGTGSFSGAPAVFNQLAFDSDDNPYVLWALGQGYNYSTRVSKFDGTAWNVIGGGNIFSGNTYSSQSIAIDPDDSIFVCHNLVGSHQMEGKKYTGTGWVSFTDATSFIGEYINLASDSDGKLFLAFQNQAMGNYTSVQVFDGTTWESVGPNTISGIANYQDFTIDQDDVPYVVYNDSDAGGKATVQKYVSAPQVSINEIEPDGSGIIAFPNPSSGPFTITAEETIHRVEMFNMTGKLVYNAAPDAKKFTIADHSWPAGLYIINFYTERGLKSLQIVIN